jgi:hypothetical protein
MRGPLFAEALAAMPLPPEIERLPARSPKRLAPPPSWIEEACACIEAHLREQYQQAPALRAGGFR